MFKSLTQTGPFSVTSIQEMHFYKEGNDFDIAEIDRLYADEKVRLLETKFKMDKNRIMVILLTRLLKRLIIKSKEAINKQDNIYVNALSTFCLVSQEYLIEPLATVSVGS